MSASVRLFLCVWYSLIVALFATFVLFTIEAKVSLRATHIACVEDESCWDCHTMGNHVCGKE
jgi:hypothetical protein